MKNHLFKPLLALALVLVCGNVWGETKTVTFDVSKNPGSWPSDNSTTLTNYTYSLNGVDYTFGLKNVKCNSGYLMLSQPAVLGLPAIEGYKLTKVVAKNSSGCSTSVNVGVSSSATSASYISGGEAQKWATTSSTYTYDLTSTSNNTVYYLYVTSKNAQIVSLELTYEVAGGTIEKTLSSIAVSGVPAKTEYEAGESFDPTGLVVTGTYDDTSVATITSGIEWTVTPNPLTAGTISVSIVAKVGNIVSDAYAVNGITVNEAVDYAMLPFTYDGGKSNLPVGLTQSGLGSDYPSSPKMKFDATGEYLVLKINEAPGDLKFDIKGNSFSGGTFKVQTSVDGSSYNDLASYNSLGDKKSLSFYGLDSNIRYIKWIYAEKSNGNVAIGNIQLAKVIAVDYWVVNYDANGGEDAPESVQVSKGQSTTISAAMPTREGYEFVGWTLTKNGDDFVSGSYTPSANVTLYAKWIVKSYKLSLIISSEDENAMVSVTGGKMDLEENSSSTMADYQSLIEVTVVANDGYYYSISASMENGEPISITNDNFSMPAGEVVVTVSINKVNLSQFSIVTSVSDLVSGDQIIIVGIETKDGVDSYYAMAPYVSGNNCKKIAVNVPVDGVIIADVPSISLGKTKKGWTLFDGTYYLYAAGGTGSNYLKGTDNADSYNAQWTIDIEEGKAMIVSVDAKVSRNTIRYNEQSDLFSCYLSDNNQSPVYIYKKQVQSQEIAISSVGLATAYMGFDATVSGADAYYVTVSDGMANLTKVEGVIPANTGVVLEAQNGGATTATFTESVATVEDKAAAEGNMLVGSTVGKTFDDEGYTYYILSKGTGEKADAVGFYWDKNSDNGKKANCGANKAILAVPATEGAATSSISIRFDGATMIENIVEVENNIYFDLQGRKVENPSNGLYIVNGKKMLVK